MWPLCFKSYNTIQKQYMCNDDIKERYILIFDTETTGLPKRNWTNYNPYGKDNKHISSNENDFPHIVQLCFILYDSYENKIILCNNEIILLPIDIQISKDSINIHKITKEMTQNINNRSIHNVLLDFMDAFYKADIIVAHNISFDRNLILVELVRTYKITKCDIFKKYIKDFFYNKKEYCTCSFGSDECKILKTNSIGNLYYSKPKLQYLYEFLFNRNINVNILHDAYYDVLICFCCFFKLRYNEDIHNKLNIFNSLFQ